MSEALIANIRTSVEIDLTIHAPGIATRFLEWWDREPNQVYYDSRRKEHVDPLHPHMSIPWDLGEVDVYTIDCYVFGVYRHDPYRGQKENTLRLHLYPNVPVQAFYEFAPTLFEKLGITDWTGDDRYLAEVKQSLDTVTSKKQGLEK